MLEMQVHGSHANSYRQIGLVGTVARVVIGLFAVGYALVGGQVVVTHGELRTGFEPVGVLLGVIGFPAVLLAWQGIRARQNPIRFEATGLVGTALNMVIFLALFLTPWYARAFSFTSDAALIFYGSSMLLASIRGYGGCEVLAISNWVLGRDDQVGCFVFGPVDFLEQRQKRA